MRILIDPGTYDFTNLGCVAVLQICLERLRGLFPHATIHVFTADPSGLARHCSHASVLSTRGPRSWYSDTELLGRLQVCLPKPVSKAVALGTRILRQSRPELLHRALSWKARLHGDGGHAITTYLTVVRQADLIVISGLGGLRGSEINTLDTLETALALRKPTAMFGLGLSGDHSDEILARARKILPNVDLIAVRERSTAPQLLQRLGVREDRIAVTGDDAIEAAFRLCPNVRGQSLGVNLRVQRTSGVQASFIATLRPVIHGFAKRHRARLQPLPGANDRGIHDCETIRAVVDGYDAESDGGEELDEPRKVILAVGRCRAVFTGAYHIAVFALSQGIPTVCVAHSDYFTDKMLCLAAMFGAGCHFVSLRHADSAQHIEHALDKAWNAPESTRHSLSAAASRQIEAGHAAYRRLLSVCAPALQPERDVLFAS